MMDQSPALTLLTPLAGDPESLAPALAEACASGRVAAVILRLGAGDERSLINRVKALAPLAQERGAALVIAGDDATDLAAVAARSGADGIHVSASADLAALRERLKENRILGVGELRTRHEAMQAGEAGAEYVLFGEPRPDGYIPPLAEVIERVEWWAEIFSTPCVGYAPRLDDIPAIAAAGAEFVALGDAVWLHPAGAGAAIEDAVARLASRLPA